MVINFPDLDEKKTKGKKKRKENHRHVIPLPRRWVPSTSPSCAHHCLVHIALNNTVSMSTQPLVEAGVSIPTRWLFSSGGAVQGSARERGLYIAKTQWKKMWRRSFVGVSACFARPTKNNRRRVLLFVVPYGRFLPSLPPHSGEGSGAYQPLWLRGTRRTSQKIMPKNKMRIKNGAKS